MRKALELIPVDGNGTTAFITVSYLLAVTMSLGANVTKLERALQISDDAIRRYAAEYTLYIVRYACARKANKINEKKMTSVMMTYTLWVYMCIYMTYLSKRFCVLYIAIYMYVAVA